MHNSRRNEAQQRNGFYYAILVFYAASDSVNNIPVEESITLEWDTIISVLEIWLS